MSEGWLRNAQELHARFDMKGRVELLKTGSQGPWDLWADGPSPFFESGVQENQQTRCWVPSNDGTVAKGRKGRLQVQDLVCLSMSLGSWPLT